MELEHRLLDVIVGVDDLQRQRADARQDAERRFADVVRRHFDEGVVETDANRCGGDGLVVVGCVDKLQGDRDLEKGVQFEFSIFFAALGLPPATKDTTGWVRSTILSFLCTVHSHSKQYFALE